MKATVIPSKISGTVAAPASKSAMQRACAAALIRGGKTFLTNPGISADDQAAIDIIRQLGAVVSAEKEKLLIESTGVHPVSDSINCGESGLSVRMFTPIAALSEKEITVNGKGSLVKRPLSFFDEVLPQLDVQCRSENGFLPLKIRGPLQPKNIEVDGSLSSQFLTGLLFAYAAADASDVTITVNNLNSRPYIDLTLKLMKDFGLKLPLHQDYKEFYFERRSSSPFTNDTIHYSVEADWSGGAFLLVAGALAGEIKVKGLDIFSAQADRAVLQALMQAEARLSITDQEIEIGKSKLKAFHFNATDCPDLFPPLVSLAAFCTGTSVIEGVHRLTHKESNRALTLQEEFGKMGIDVRLQDDLMLIEGRDSIKGASVSSHHDHRIAMACAVAALRAEDQTVIEGAEAVNKSYPQFWDHLEKLHADLILNNT
jgi:3-phosphoshikimate 1-carboxyvinyltransferase